MSQFVESLDGNFLTIIITPREAKKMLTTLKHFKRIVQGVFDLCNQEGVVL